MDKKALQTYATWSKQNLEQQIELSLKSLGIHGDDDIREAKRVGDVTIIDGDSTSYPAELKSQRDAIIRLIKASGYNNTVETFAYTWFNRIIALRFMEVHGFLPHGFRVLSDSTGDIEPEILKNLNFVRSDLKLDMDVCSLLKEKNDIDALFRYVLFKQCNALSGILPMLFDSEESYLELMLPKSLLKGDTVITRLLEIPENTFLNDIEVIGWLYQYYVSSKKDKVFADLKKNIKIPTESIPAATQLFTPDWIVRYMVENSLGRIWLESYPNSSLKMEMKYFVDEVLQTEDVEIELQKTRYRNVNPEELRVLEPCCGSGHILVYLFDLLYKMYIEKGYISRDIPTLILKNNLFGLEIDKRAAQLAAFALVMRARSINNRFFDKNYYVRPQIFEIYDSKELLDMNYRKQLSETNLLDDEVQEVNKIVNLFENAKNYGSLIDVSQLDFDILNNAISKLHSEIITTFNYRLLNDGLKLIIKLIAQAKILSSKYDVCITNPPYMGSGNMNVILVEYLKKTFPDSKSDLSTAFMEKCEEFTSESGYYVMINIPVWMFIASYEDLRKKILLKNTYYNMVHFGRGVFGSDFGTTAFVIRKKILKNYKGTYKRLFDKQGAVDSVETKEKWFLEGKNTYYSCQESFSDIPGCPVAYWVSNDFILNFKHESISSEFFSGGRNKTHNNEKYLRLWWEIDNEDKWQFYDKGGDFRKWYGNHESVVDWSENAKADYNSHGGLYNQEFANKVGICWTLITSAKTAFRVKPASHHYDSGSPVIFNESFSLDYELLGFLNTNVSLLYLNLLNPTINMGNTYVLSLPLIRSNNPLVDSLVKENIEISKTDWDSFENSRDFDEHPFVKWSHDLWDLTAIGANMQYYYGCHPTVSGPLELCYMLWQGECKERFQKLKKNEEELNRIFIDVYGLQKELTPDVADEDVTVHKADLQRDVKSFISYLVGVVMGRYSLDVHGLSYWGGKWDDSKYRSYQPDDDGIVPIYVGVGMEDGLTARLAELVKLIYGNESFKANIDFIAEALGKANNESSLETLNRYLNEGFYADHLKIYQKRPIYWLFSSGKHKGFKCLVYMHRYNKDTLARINAKYYLPESTRQKITLEELEDHIKTADGKERIRLEKNRQKLFDKYNETIEYGQVLDHMANKYIDLNLDDGVKVNYAKFQGVELVSDSGVKTKKDLLVPLK